MEAINKDNSISEDAMFDISDAPIEEIKACVDCEFLLGVRYHTDESEKNWRCVHPNNLPTQGEVKFRVDVVTGIKKRVVIVAPIYIVRANHCKGNWWGLYEKPDYKSHYAVGENEEGKPTVTIKKTSTIRPSLADEL